MIGRFPYYGVAVSESTDKPKAPSWRDVSAVTFFAWSMALCVSAVAGDDPTFTVFFLVLILLPIALGATLGTLMIPLHPRGRKAAVAAGIPTFLLGLLLTFLL